jgi:ferredoxin
MRVALCTCNGKVKREELEKIEETYIFDDMCKYPPPEFFDIVCCDHPAVRKIGKIHIDLNELIFLKQEDAAEKAKLLLRAFGELLNVNPRIMRIGIDTSLLLRTDDVDFAKKAQKHFDPLYILTTNEGMKGIGIPIRGKIIEIRGELGKFRVFLDGVNLYSGEKVSEIRVSQVVIPGFNFTKDGIFNSEREILEAISNVGEVLKFKALDYDGRMCAVSVNNVSGCRLCECIHNCLEHDNNVILDYNGCLGCGRCSSLCPTDALKFDLMPRDIVRRQVDIFSTYSGDKVLVYVCRDSLSKVYASSGKIGTFFPIIVPCIAALSEIEVLYPLLKGFNGVYILACSNCPHGNFDGVELAMKVCKAFGIDNLILHTSFKETNIDELLSAESVCRDLELDDASKREQLLKIVQKIKETRKLTDGILESIKFGEVMISEKCTLCDTCSYMCPTNAIRKQEGEIKFVHGLCINCKLCEKLCPEGAIRVKPILNLPEFDIEKIIKEDEMISCPKCGKRHISKAEFIKISEITGQRYSLMFCRDCRPVVVFEGIYKEMFGGEKNE